MFMKIKRLRKMWNMTSKEKSAIDSLTEKEIDALPNTGNGKAQFFTEGTQKDLEEFEREQTGFKGIFGL